MAYTNEKKYRGIIFDLDGTLANTLEDIAGSMNYILSAHGYPELPVTDYKLLVGKGLDNLVTQALPLPARHQDNIQNCLSEMIRHYNINCIAKTHLYPGIKNMLETLLKKNIPMAVFSNKAEPLTIKIINCLLPDFPFVAVAGARPDVPKKPDPEGALNICKKMELVPDSVVYAGDSDVDMITASSAGMFGVGVSWGFRSIEELIYNGAGSIVHDPMEIPGMFNI